MSKVIAIIVADLSVGRLGLACDATSTFRVPSLPTPGNGEAAPSSDAVQRFRADLLRQTLERLAGVAAIEHVVVVHPPGQAVAELLANQPTALPRSFLPVLVPDGYTASHQVARKWALRAWRGGLGGATCYDELLPAAAWAAAMQAQQAESALLVGGDWAAVDPALCEQVLARHLAQPQAMPLIFSMAPPGLCGVAIGRALVEQLAASPWATLGQMLAYNPQQPQADPIGKDVCVQIDPAIRRLPLRYIGDTLAGYHAIADQQRGTTAPESASHPSATGQAPLPLLENLTLELTPQRRGQGPILPQGYTTFARGDLPVALAQRIVSQLPALASTCTLTLGGLGDALLHPQWRTVIEAAHAAGVFGIALHTDLVVETEVLEAIMASPLDVLCVHLNADSAGTYRAVMGTDDFDKVVKNIEWLLTQRNRRGQHGLWVVPHLVKTAATLAEMEGFFDRWMHFAGHAVIAPAHTGGGVMPAMSPVCMAPPARMACRQVPHRMSIHSDGRVPRCDQDWHGRQCVGHVGDQSLASLWAALQPVRDQHAAGAWATLPLCEACVEWHRP